MTNILLEKITIRQESKRINFVENSDEKSRIEKVMDSV